MRPSEFKLRYDVNLDRYVKKHIYDDETSYVHGKGMTDVFKAVGKKLLGKTAKSAVKKAAIRKAGDEIVKLLRENKTTPSVLIEPNKSISEPKKLSEWEINERVNQLLSGGNMRNKRKMKFI